ncbi:MAG: CBS domain-containing protein [Gammaproteobacteria bacterium]|nr:CBS domain-containing protein [Gammaproteobacteria bacterium]MBU1725190.1 CBS domain-containing protein [Gammaproteobacteria bacterium]MBU2005116.1 CBS domain-containing protein [Gammaproteobacteria bacterium]
MALEKQDFLAALKDYSEEPNILPDELWWLYQSALRHAAIREKSAHLLSELMTSPVMTVQPDDLLDDVSRRMLEKRVSGFPVVKNGKLFGIVTEGDLLSAMGVPTRSPQTSRMQKVMDAWRRPDAHIRGNASKVSDVMTRSVIVAEPEDTLEHGLKLMGQHQVTRLVITNRQNQVTGIVTRTDILRFTCAAPHTTPLPPPANAG